VSSVNQAFAIGRAGFVTHRAGFVTHRAGFVTHRAGFAFTLGLASLGLGQGSGIAVELRPLRGEPIRGELRALASDAVSIEVSGEGTRKFASADLRAIRFSKSVARAPGAARLELAGGDLLVGAIAGGDGDLLSVALGGRPARVPVDAIRRIVFPERVPPRSGELEAPPEGDRLWRARPGSVLEPVNGTLIAFKEKGLEFESSVIGRKEFAYDEVIALTIAPLDAASSQPAPMPVVVLLAPEGRLSGSIAGFAGGVFTLESPALKRTSIPARAVRAIRFRSDRFVEVSELEPADVVETPYFGGPSAVRFPWQRNRNVSGGPLRVGGVEFATGLGVHSRCVLTYATDGHYSGFVARAGIDDVTIDLPRKGSVVFRVLGDGKKLWESPIVRGGERALSIPEIPLAGVKRLALEVDYADGLDIADRADWCEPILLRDPAPSGR